MLIERIRVSVFFPTRLPEAPRVPSWQEVGEGGPEQTINRTGFRAEVGPFDRGVLQITSQLPLRADLFYGSRGASDAPDEDVPNVGTPQDVTQVVMAPVRRFLAAVSPITRLAVGMSAFEAMATREAVLAGLARRLPRHRLDLQGARDFMFQTNRPLASTVVQGLMINRLNKWLEAQITHSAMDREGRVGTALTNFSLTLETDVNTDAEWPGPLNQAQLGALFEELCKLSVEMVERGEPG